MHIWAFWCTIKTVSSNENICFGKIEEKYPSLFTWHENNSRIGVIIVHVGDFFFAGNDSDERNLRQTIAIGKEESKQEFKEYNRWERIYNEFRMC